MARTKRAHQTDSKRYHDWLERAGEDVLGAYHLMEVDLCYNIAVFHCQQAMEKSLKAYILVLSGQLVDGHNLTWLFKRAGKMDPSLLEWVAVSVKLNRGYIETRYPSDIITEYDFAEVREYYRLAKKLYFYICGELDHSDRRLLESGTGEEVLG